MSSPSALQPTRRVLVVEDEPHIRELVRLHLGLEGLAVTEAGDGEATSGPGIGGFAACHPSILERRSCGRALAASARPHEPYESAQDSGSSLAWLAIGLICGRSCMVLLSGS